MSTRLVNISTLICLLLSIGGQAQTADATLSPREILIGEQAVINLSVSYTKGAIPKVDFPQFGDTLMNLVEVIRTTDADTLATSDDVSESRIEQKIYITSFDSGYYAIPPFEILVNGEIQRTEAFLFTVRSVEIDTTATIKPPKDIYEIEVGWQDYLQAYWYIPAGVMGVAVLAAIIFLLVKRRKRHEYEWVEQELEDPAKPIHIAVLERLEAIREKAIYKRDKVKLYHTEITDALRDYIEGVYQVQAHEFTTRQILSGLKYVGLTQTESLNLNEILSRADMVKFAKEIPSEVENESAVEKAIEFVRTTSARINVDKEIRE